MSRWLVGSSSKEQVGPLADDQRQRKARLLAAGEVADRGRGHVAAKIEAAQEVAQLLLARVGLELAQVPQRRMLVAQLLDLVLREVAEAQPLRVRRVPASGASVPAIAFSSVDLPAPLGPRRPMRSPARMPKVSRSSTGGRPVVAERRVLEQHELARGARGRRERELERAVDVRRGNELHALERLDPALRLLGLGGLGAKAVDERLQVRDLPLLLRVRRLRKRELLRALASSNCA